MKIIPGFDRLHSGENASRKIDFTIEEEYYGMTVKLGFLTPMGNIHITDALTYSDGQGSFLLPCSLLDGKGVLLCQLFVTDGKEYICKSPVLELPVYQSVDDMNCPDVSDETLKSFAVFLETLENKADIGHIHEGVYLTKEELTEFIYSEMSGGYEHIHDDRYYTEAETDSIVEKAIGSHSHSYSELSDKPALNGIALEGNADVNGLMYRRLLTSADDLDEIFEDGVYVYSTSSVPANAPFENAAVVEVFGAKSTSTQKIQRAYRYGVAGCSAFRPLYGNKWLEWTQNTDHVTQQGTSGKWTYRKWNSGISEAWGIVEITVAKDAYNWNSNIYCVSGFGKLPSDVFTSVDCVSSAPINWYQIGASARVTAGLTLEANIFGITTNMSSLVKNDTINLNCIIKGRWK